MIGSVGGEAAPSVVALGEVLCRLSPPAGERLEHARNMSLHVGGAEANVVAGLARLGITSAIVSALPASPLGLRARGELALAGVDLRHLSMGPATDRIATFFVERSSGAWPTEVWYDRAGSHFAQTIRWSPGALQGARFAVVCGITPAVSDHARAACLDMVDEAAARGVKICIDVNYRARLWSPEAAREAIEPLLARASVVICSERDAELLFGAAATDPERLRERFAPAAEHCIVTRGELGAICHVPGVGQITAPAQPARGGDRIGIGDAFTAGVLCGLLEGRDPAEVLRLGSRAAALKAGTIGDMSLAHRLDLDVVTEGVVRR